MSQLGSRLVRGLSANIAQTALDEVDPRLQGRTLAIPFDRVWEAARALAMSARGWQVVEADDYDGIIRAEVTTLVWKRTGDVVIHIGLDENGQTRVDMRSSSRKGHADLGSNARRINRFMRNLDRALERPREVPTTKTPR